MFDIEEVLEKASPLEKVTLLGGRDQWYTSGLPKYGVPAIKTTDGPNGVRGEKQFNSVPALCIPCGTGLAATWNDDLVQQAGQLMSKECAAKGARVWLGPNVNIIRSPMNGRGFECFSEDPHLSGMLAAAIIRGVRSGGTLAALKHFVANDQETEKISVDVCMSERALREIYLKPFQIALRDSDPRIVMSSYNKVQGTHASESPKLLDQILRKEWGFDDLVMSDWFGTYSREDALKAGLDIEMPGPPRHRTKDTILSMATGKLDRHTIEVRARKVLQFVKEAMAANVEETETTRDVPEDRVLNRQLATEGIVLLKNSTGLLPLNAQDGDEVALIGPNVKVPGACGGGSANVRPYYTSSIYQGITALLPPTARVHHEPGVYDYDLLPVFSQADVTDDAGRPGATIEFFNEPCTSKSRVAFDAYTIPDTAYQLMDFVHAEMRDPFYISMRAGFTPPESGTYEFGIATYGVGDLYIDDELAVENSRDQVFGGMFFGKGSTERRGTFDMQAGKRYTLRLEAGSASTSTVVGGHGLPLPGGACRLGGRFKIEQAVGIQRAVDLARKCKTTIVVVGLNSDIEKEGRDRQMMEMPSYTDKMVGAVLAANPSAIVITQAGTQVTMPWRDAASTMLHTWYGGNEAGNAVADVLFGRANPSGKLPVTFPARLEDVPSFLSFGRSDNGKVTYTDDIFVGYRGYEARDVAPAFPFGHGLSYTSFSAAGVCVDRAVNPTRLSVDVTNTGARAGAEVVFLYVGFSPATTRTTTTSRSSSSAAAPAGHKSRFHRPKRELKGYKKIHLSPGQTETVTIPINKYSTAVWDDKRESWCCEKGRYVASAVVGSSSDEAFQAPFEIDEDEYWTGL